MINSGAGTAFNMNCNEVISNVALEILHKKKGREGQEEHRPFQRSSNPLRL